MFNFASHQFTHMNSNIINLTSKQKAVIDNLVALNDEQVISLIQDFRENGELFIVSPLIEMLYFKRGQVLKNSILDFIADIKNQDAVSIISQSIQKHMGDKNTSGLISACWQSNLDFSNEIPIFIDILCNADYQSSFDAFTVIENSIGNVSTEQIGLYITTIESRLKATPLDKKSLLTEMIVTLENFRKNGVMN
jgi:hypothetical protein